MGLGKGKHENIKIVTDKGNHVTLKWEHAEYRAYDAQGKDMRLGATLPENLILYIQKKY